MAGHVRVIVVAGCLATLALLVGASGCGSSRPRSVHRDWSENTTRRGDGPLCDPACPSYDDKRRSLGRAATCGACGDVRFIRLTGRGGPTVFYYDASGRQIGQHTSFCLVGPDGNADDEGVVVQCDELENAPACDER
jgi:hypothetical protein